MPECERCHGSGWAKDALEAVFRCKSCDYWQRKRGETPGCPVEFRKLRWADVKQTSENDRACQRCEEFIAGQHPDLYLWGKTGRGKTFLALAVLNSLFEVGQRALFVRVSELLLQLRGDNDAEVFDRVTTTPLIVLDDIGSHQGTDYARSKMQLIYDKRIDYNNRTIFTSNLSLVHLLDFLDDNRIPSRIAGRSMVVEVEGRDWRIKKPRRAARSKA